ncbi:hypothetical protein [Rhizobacter sp. LjRoot28]|jgi:hypothetical protein|uniref:hypothetical protein n=1 Tax=Rhizobacter sp. LjRoot28 TaxID=3342309 RepID=UPI003ECCF9E1
MPEPIAELLAGLRAVGGASALFIALPGAVAALWALYVWADEARTRRVRRIAGLAALALGLGLLLRLGLGLMGPPPLLPLWQWALGLLVLPVFVRSSRLGGVAAMLFFLCLAMALATGVSWVGDVQVATGLALVAGAGALAVALALGRLSPAPLAPPAAPAPVPPNELQDRLASDEANEAADKYTRE